MKKLLYILLLLIYTIASFGFIVKQFYCCGQPKSISFVLKQDLNEKCSQSSERGDCENQFHTLSHAASVKFSNPAKYIADLHLLAFGAFYRDRSLTAFERIVSTIPTNAPPLHSVVPIYIFNCIYRI